MEAIIQLAFFIGILVVTFFIGNKIEKSHFERLAEKEKDLMHIPVVAGQKFLDDRNVEKCELVFGNVVISGDYFKMILAALSNIFGGRITSYETLIDRARREAILRMKVSAQQINADIILNTRFETSKLDSMAKGKNGGGTGMFEIIAYGTAIKYAK